MSKWLTECLMWAQQSLPERRGSGQPEVFSVLQPAQVKCRTLVTAPGQP